MWTERRARFRAAPTSSAARIPHHSRPVGLAQHPPSSTPPNGALGAASVLSWRLLNELIYSNTSFVKTRNRKHSNLARQVHLVGKWAHNTKTFADISSDVN